MPAFTVTQQSVLWETVDRKTQSRSVGTAATAGTDLLTSLLAALGLADEPKGDMLV